MQLASNRSCGVGKARLECLFNANKSRCAVEAGAEIVEEAKFPSKGQVDRIEVRRGTSSSYFVARRVWANVRDGADHVSGTILGCERIGIIAVEPLPVRTKFNVRVM